MLTYTTIQKNGYKAYVRGVILFNQKYGTDYTPMPIDKFEWNECVICDKMITDDAFGNNPFPVKEDGRCCSKCNTETVVPARVRSMFG
jgi:hypothetical protein